MQINPVNSNLKSGKLAIMRIQDEILPFTEKPSDKYAVSAAKFTSGRDNRKNAFELFSLFTADIIKKNVVYTK